MLIVLKQVQLMVGTKTPQSLGQNYHNTTHELVLDTDSRTVAMRSRTRDDGWTHFPAERVDFLKAVNADLGPGFLPKMTEIEKDRRGVPKRTAVAGQA